MCILVIRIFLIREISQLRLVSDVVRRFNGSTVTHWVPKASRKSIVRTGEPSDEDSTQHLDRNHEDWQIVGHVDAFLGMYQFEQGSVETSKCGRY